MSIKTSLNNFSNYAKVYARFDKKRNAEQLLELSALYQKLKAPVMRVYTRVRLAIVEETLRRKASSKAYVQSAHINELIRQFSSLHAIFRPYRVPTFVLCLGLILSILGFIGTLQRNMDDLERQFYNYTATQAAAVEQQFSNYLSDMELSQHFFKTSTWVTKEEFATFIYPLKKRGNFSLFARVDYDPEEERVSILQANIVEDALKRTDVGSLLEKLDIIKGLRQAKEEGVLVATKPFSMLNQEEYHLGIAYPYYQLLRQIDGFVVGVLNLKQIFSQELEWEAKRRDVAVYIYDISNNNPSLIYTSNERDIQFGPNIENAQPYETIDKQSPFHHKTTLNLANRTWEIFFIPTTHYLANITNIFPWLTLVGGMVITGLISLFMFYLTTRNIRVSKIVEERTQDLELAMKKLTRTNLELERFAYVASHDLQEPLRLVSNFTRILHEDYGKKFDKEGREYVGIIIDETEHMQDMIKGLLDYARIEKLPEMPKQKANCKQLLQRVLKNLRMRIKETGATVTYDEMPTIIGYTVPVVQLFQNLIGNSLKYCRNHPPVIRIGCEDKRDYWLFSVKDNGIGISEEHFEHIFEPFKRLHRKDEFQGSGIGLAVCKKIVEYMGGRIWVNSQLGKGSTFYFTVPKDTEQETKNDTKN